MGRLARMLPALATALAAGTLAACAEREPPAAVAPAPSAADVHRVEGAAKDDPAAAGAPSLRAPARPARSDGRAARQPRAQLTVHVTRPAALRATPGGRVVARVEPRTEFDSPTVLPVVRRRDGWLGVLPTALPNGRIAWLSANAALVPHRTRWRVDASLSRREVVVRRAGRVVLRFPVAVGGPSTPTPTGRFAVTDKLLTNDPGSPYGCCILALNARQPHTPQGWGGGDRVAIHATNLPETIGAATSLGCLRAPTDAMREAVRRVPLGTIVTVRA